MPETTIAALATISIGAIWSSCSPDFGVPGALDRFSQVKPKIFFAVDGYYYKSKEFNNLEKIKNVVEQVTSIEKTVIIPLIGAGLPSGCRTEAVLFDDFIANESVPELEFKKFPFSHPIYILFTSGTTGVPKCLVPYCREEEYKLECKEKEALWDRYYMVAPGRQRRCVEKYKIVKRA